MQLLLFQFIVKLSFDVIKDGRPYSINTWTAKQTWIPWVFLFMLSPELISGMNCQSVGWCVSKQTNIRLTSSVVHHGRLLAWSGRWTHVRHAGVRTWMMRGEIITVWWVTRVEIRSVWKKIKNTIFNISNFFSLKLLSIHNLSCKIPCDKLLVRTNVCVNRGNFYMLEQYLRHKTNNPHHSPSLNVKLDQLI